MVNLPRAARLGEAFFSEDGVYRYTLTRDPDLVRRELPSILWIMLNPSTADAQKDDPTIRRCRAFAGAWGYGRVEICNIFALRSTDPNQLYRAVDPIGPDNDFHIAAAVGRAGGHVVAAWGTHAKLGDRDRAVMMLLRGLGVRPVCLGVNQDGTPRHPLYVASSTFPALYEGRR